MTKRRFAVVISHPIQHFVPLFARLAQDERVDLKVFYCCDWGVKSYRDPGFGQEFAWNIPLLEGYSHEFLPIAKRPEGLGFWDIDNPEVGRRLDDFQPEAVWVHGYGHRTSWRALKWARGKARVLYFGDSELLYPRGWKARLFKRLVLPPFFRRIDGFLTIGDNNEDYYRHYGVPNSKLIRGSFPVDVGRFQNAISGLTTNDRHEIRSRYGIPSDATVALFIGKFIDIKRPFDLIDAVDALRDRQPGLHALMVGSGPLEEQIKTRIASRNLQSRVHLTGFVNQAEIPSVLWAGDLLAMTSERDPHPLAVTEAMSVGNAVVATDRVGCVGPTDAARIGKNAIVYPSGNVAALSDILDRLCRNPQERQSMSEESKRLAWTQDVSVAADGVLRFLTSQVAR